jgi:hypothetical protein
LYTEDEAKKRKIEIMCVYPYIETTKDTPIGIIKKTMLDNIERFILLEEVESHTRHEKTKELASFLGIK